MYKVIFNTFEEVEEYQDQLSLNPEVLCASFGYNEDSEPSIAVTYQNGKEEEIILEILESYVNYEEITLQ